MTDRLVFRNIASGMAHCGRLTRTLGCGGGLGFGCLGEVREDCARVGKAETRFLQALVLGLAVPLSGDCVDLDPDLSKNFLDVLFPLVELEFVAIEKHVAHHASDHPASRGVGKVVVVPLANECRGVFLDDTLQVRDVAGSGRCRFRDDEVSGGEPGDVGVKGGCAFEAGIAKRCIGGVGGGCDGGLEEVIDGEGVDEELEIVGLLRAPLGNGQRGLLHLALPGGLVLCVQAHGDEAHLLDKALVGARAAFAAFGSGGGMARGRAVHGRSGAGGAGGAGAGDGGAARGGKGSRDCAGDEREARERGKEGGRLHVEGWG
mmetsp:Transcript_16384/g.43927  ORF Transcript_16384/g.43927 Transcript_16384/m.43927 type:complete len:318 (+) Transcript_16384:41-994(+)